MGIYRYTRKLVYKTHLSIKLRQWSDSGTHVWSRHRFPGRRGGATSTRSPTSWCIFIVGFVSTATTLQVFRTGSIRCLLRRPVLSGSVLMLFISLVMWVVVNKKHYMDTFIRSKPWWSLEPVFRGWCWSSRLLSLPGDIMSYRLHSTSPPYSQTCYDCP